MSIPFCQASINSLSSKALSRASLCSLPAWELTSRVSLAKRKFFFTIRYILAERFLTSSTGGISINAPLHALRLSPYPLYELEDMVCSTALSISSSFFPEDASGPKAFKED